MQLPTEKRKPKRLIKDVSILIYGPTKIGKSEFCSQGDGVLFLSTEPGLNALEIYPVDITNWQEMSEACGLIAAGAHKFQTVVIDTIDNAYKMCAQYICEKNRVEYQGDMPMGKGWSLVMNEFYRMLLKLAQLPYGLILVSHSKEEQIETRTGSYTKIMPTLPGQAAKTVLGLVDIVLYCDFDVSYGADGKRQIRRVIKTKATPEYEAGDRYNILPEILPLDYGAFTQAFEGKKQEPEKPAQVSLPVIQKEGK